LLQKKNEQDALQSAASWSLTALPLEVGPATVSLARRFVEKYRELLGVDRLADMKHMRSAASMNPAGHVILGIDFKQTYRGYDVRSPIEHMRVKLRIDATLGRLSLLGSDWVRNLECEIDPMPRDAAVEKARLEIPPFAPGLGRVHRFETYVLVEAGPASETELTARLVHHVMFDVEEPPAAWSVILDAATGRLLRKHSDLLHTDVIGNVAAGTLDDGPNGAFKVVPMRSLQVSVQGGGSGVTDASGNFKISHPGTSQVTITGRYAGDWCAVANNAGANTTFSMPATPGQAANVVMNPTHQHEFTTAEATAYRFTTYTHFFVAKRYPNYTGIPKMVTNVNINNRCNAFYRNSTINFYKSGSRGSYNCPNTAYEEVVAHEYGHAFHVVFHGSYNPLSFSEGIGDHLGLFVSDQRIIGRDFLNQGQHIRDYRPGKSAHQTQWPSKGKEVHKAGEIWGGFCMDLRDLLVVKHGVAKGKDISEIITITQYSRNPTDMPDGVIEVLVQDDDDSNLKNGTPNFKLIAQAADNHLLPRPPDPPTVQFKHTGFPDTRDTVNAYVITAEVTSQAGTVTRATLSYKVGSGAYTTLTMTKVSGDTYTASIPAQKAVSRIEYFLEGWDDKKSHERYPDIGSLGFTVGHMNIFFADDFETDRGWTGVHTATSGRFERVDPFQATWTGNPIGDCQPEDDHTAGTGKRCYVTENGLRGREAYLFDVDNGSTEIQSPTFDLSAVTPGAARIKYARWFYTFNNNDDTLDVDVSTDGGKAWKSLEQVAQNENRWTVVESMLPGPYTTQMKIRFRTADNPNNSVTDALIDDVSVVVFDDDVAELTANTRTPGVGTTLKFDIEALKRPGSMYFWAFSFSPGPVSVPGLGVLDLGWPVFLVISKKLDASGKGRFEVPVPMAPILKGMRVYTEAMVYSSGGILSNPWNIQIK